MNELILELVITNAGIEFLTRTTELSTIEFQVSKCSDTLQHSKKSQSRAACNCTVSVLQKLDILLRYLEHCQ